LKEKFMDQQNASKTRIVPTRSESIAILIDSYFSVRGRNWLAILSVIFGVLSLSWLADSLLPILQDAGTWFYSYQNSLTFETKFGEHFVRLMPVILVFVEVSFLLYLNHRNNLKVLDYRRVASQAHRGLIVCLSDYKDFGKTLPTVADVEKAIDASTLDLEEFFNKSNWGQLAFAVAHHSSLLQRCWICTTPKTTETYDIAVKLIKYVSKKMGGRELDCEEIKVEDENDISRTAVAVSNVYRNLESMKTGLLANDVIANFTGGTAAMTGGIIMATLDAGRAIEYNSQAFFGKLSLDLLSSNQTEFAIISPTTNLLMAERLSRKSYE